MRSEVVLKGWTCRPFGLIALLRRNSNVDATTWQARGKQRLRQRRTGATAFRPTGATSFSTRAVMGEDKSTNGQARGNQVPLLSVAPMMEWTDVFYRNLARLMTKRTWLYTEMIVDKTLIFKDKEGNSLDKFLYFPEAQHPVVLQLGGNGPSDLAAAVKLANSYGYDEINLNCGCPSPRVSGKGCFGAALMKEPPTVRNIVNSMENESPVPVTIKCRLGVDDNDTYPELVNFIKETSEGLSIDHYIIHARKALLNGLSPAQNRSVPPLKYDWVFQLSKDFPHLKFSLNGGVQTLQEAKELLERKGEDQGRLHGVMIGRAAYKTPWHTLADSDRLIFGEEENPCTSRRQVLTDYAEMCDRVIESRGPMDKSTLRSLVRKMVKPLLGMFHGEPGTNKWKRQIEDSLQENPSTASQVIFASMEHIASELLDAGPEVRFTHTRNEKGETVLSVVE